MQRRESTDAWFGYRALRSKWNCVDGRLETRRIRHLALSFRNLIGHHRRRDDDDDDTDELDNRILNMNDDRSSTLSCDKNDALMIAYKSSSDMGLYRSPLLTLIACFFILFQGSISDADDVPICTSNSVDVDDDISHRVAAGSIQVLNSLYGVPQTIHDDSANDALDRFRRMERYMAETVMVDDYYRSVRAQCRNLHADCVSWAVQGQCEVAQHYMQVHCAPACMACENLSFELRCLTHRSSSTTADAWKPGDLDAMFQRITQDSVYQQQQHQYQPVILSRPGQINPFTRGDSPWMVVLENFVSADDCETLQELGRLRGYQRSTTIGAGRDDAGALQQVGDYEGRTSQNAWCLDDCHEHPVVQRVLQKIANVTGLAESHAEYLQLLRYEEGDFYHTHHDYVPTLQEGMAGPRILTVFLYLNDVDAGGGTLFTDLNITIQPKQGSALLWPSVLNDKPNQKDRRMHHAALVVEHGVKYGANVWVSQRGWMAWGEGAFSILLTQTSYVPDSIISETSRRPMRGTVFEGVLTFNFAPWLKSVSSFLPSYI
jgi:prolyl 4-hydroxylase